MAQRFGKNRLYYFTKYICYWIYFVLLFIPGKPYMFLFALPFFSFGIGGLFTLMMSMTADTSDYEELITDCLERKVLWSDLLVDG